jgi:hypothetical protein
MVVVVTSHLWLAMHYLYPPPTNRSSLRCGLKSLWATHDDLMSLFKVHPTRMSLSLVAVRLKVKVE